MTVNELIDTLTTLREKNPEVGYYDVIDVHAADVTAVWLDSFYYVVKLEARWLDSIYRRGEAGR